MAQFKLNTTVHFNQTVLWIIEAMDYAHDVIVQHECTVTSGIDGKHSDESGHYYARSVDFRFNINSPREREEIKREAEEWLTRNAEGHYLILIESDHFHVQRQKDSF